MFRYYADIVYSIFRNRSNISRTGPEHKPALPDSLCESARCRSPPRATGSAHSRPPARGDAPVRLVSRRAEKSAGSHSVAARGRFPAPGDTDLPGQGPCAVITCGEDPGEGILTAAATDTYTRIIALSRCNRGGLDGLTHRAPAPPESLGGLGPVGRVSWRALVWPRP